MKERSKEVEGRSAREMVILKALCGLYLVIGHATDKERGRKQMPLLMEIRGAFTLPSL